MQHTQDTLPECQALENRGHKTLYHLFFIRLLSSRAREVAAFPNTKKQTKRQNEEIEKYVSNERTGLNHSKRPK